MTPKESRNGQEQRAEPIIVFFLSSDNQSFVKIICAKFLRKTNSSQEKEKHALKKIKITAKILPADGECL